MMSFSSQGTGMQKYQVEIPGVTGKFLGVQNEAVQRLTVLPREHTCAVV